MSSIGARGSFPLFMNVQHINAFPLYKTYAGTEKLDLCGDMEKQVSKKQQQPADDQKRSEWNLALERIARAADTGLKTRPEKKRRACCGPQPDCEHHRRNRYGP